jgi:hypothetical protein
MPLTTITDTPLAPPIKKVLQLDKPYNWMVLSATERMAGTTPLMEVYCKEKITEATTRMTLFFTDKTAPQITRVLRSMGIEASIGQEVNVNEDLIKGREFSAELKVGNTYNDKEGNPVTPWELDGFSVGKPLGAITQSKPAATVDTEEDPF